jgi:hypothetical protein
LLNDDNILIISGEITNTDSERYVYLPRVTVTVFDEAQHVVAAAFKDLDDVEIAPGEVIPYEIAIPQMGGLPHRYIVNVQTQP